MRILSFTIEGVLQSWGEQSSWNLRDSADWPTKSGVIGMIGAAMGLGYEDKAIGELCEAVEMGVKTKLAYHPQLDDYQTVNYFGGVLANGTRETRNAQKTIVQHKRYIMDRKFLIALSASKEVLDAIYQAMLDPVWAMHLGRACCPPSRPLLPVVGEYESLEEALVSIPLNDAETEVIQIEGTEGQRRTDVRIAAERKRYEERYVLTKVVD